MKKLIVNLGCGKTRIPGSIGVDVSSIEDYVDIVHDLDSSPYPFKDNSVDEIHMYHVLEHLHEPLKKMEEVHRILKTNGKLYLRVPHFSSMGAFSDITHIRPFGYTSFDIFEEKDLHHYYNSVDFKILKKQIKYSGLYPNTGVYEEYIHHNYCPWYLRPFIRFVNFLIDLSPLCFERVWCYYVGGATEVVIELMKTK